MARSYCTTAVDFLISLNLSTDQRVLAYGDIVPG